MEKKRKNSVNVLIMDSVSRNFSFSKSTWGRLRPVIKCADTCVLGMKYITSPILLPMYIVYAFINPTAKDAKVEILEESKNGNIFGDKDVRGGKLQSHLPGGKLRRQSAIARNERKLAHLSDNSPEIGLLDQSTNDMSLKRSNSTEITQCTHTSSLSSSSSPPESSPFSPAARIMQVGAKTPVNISIPTNETKNTRTTSNLLSNSVSKLKVSKRKDVEIMSQKINGPALADLSPILHRGT